MTGLGSFEGGLTVIAGGRSGAPVVQSRKFERRPCIEHHALEVIVEERAIECTDCGHRVDPVDAMVAVANQWERHAEWTAAIKRKREREEQKLADVKRELQNAKARLRRAKATGGTA